MKKKIIAILLILTLIGGDMNSCFSLTSQNTEINTEEKIVSNIPEEEIQNLIDNYQNDILKLIKKEKKIIYHSILEKILTKYDYQFIYQYNSDKDNNGFIIYSPVKINEDKVLHQSVQYAAEYDKDKSLTGIIKMKKINAEKYVFYEYQIKKSTPYFRDFAKLRHILIYYKTDNPIIFVAASDGDIKGIKYQDKFYLKNLSNIIEIDNIDLTYLDGNNLIANVTYKISIFYGFTTLLFSGAKESNTPIQGTLAALILYTFGIIAYMVFAVPNMIWNKIDDRRIVKEFEESRYKDTE